MKKLINRLFTSNIYSDIIAVLFGILVWRLFWLFFYWDVKGFFDYLLCHAPDVIDAVDYLYYLIAALVSSVFGGIAASRFAKQKALLAIVFPPLVICIWNSELPYTSGWDQVWPVANYLLYILQISGYLAAFTLSRKAYILRERQSNQSE